METKYTTDGRKVVVIGKLNAQETIVQEVFIIDGSEIPSGEHFVTKSLHSAPAVSWKETEIKGLEKRYSDVKIRVEEAEEEAKKALSFLGAKLVMLKETAAGIDEEGFQMVSDVLSGRVKWVVSGESYDPKITPFDEFERNSIAQRGNYGFDGFRLLSLYGGRYERDGSAYERTSGSRPKGNLRWKIHSYSDGSGGSRPLWLFVEHSDALDKLKSLIEERDYDDARVKLLVDNGLPVDPVKLAKLRSKQYGDAKAEVIALERKLEESKMRFGAMELPE